MKSHFQIRSSAAKLAILGGIVLGLGTIGFRAQATVWDKHTVLTVNQPIQIENTYLEPGTYVFRLADTPADRHVVQIYNRDQSRLINTFLAIPNYRLRPTSESRFTFYETPRDSVSAMRAWFYPGDNFGQEFRYPKQLRRLTVAAAASSTTLTRPVEPPPPPVTAQAPEPENLPAPAAAVTEPAPREEPPVIAQASPPPTPSQSEVTPVPEALRQEPIQELPKTGTPFPLIGLGGLLSLAGYGLLRMTS